MSRNSLAFLRPYLQRASRPLRPEHARAYLSIQKRYTQSIAIDDFTGPHDVEKQKRLEQLRKEKPLADYHPKLVYPSGSANVSLSEFYARYEGIQETAKDVVTTLGMGFRLHENSGSDITRQGAISTDAGFQADVP